MKENMFASSQNSLPFLDNIEYDQSPEPGQLLPHEKKTCMRFLNKMKNHKASWPFRLPVDPVAQGVPNYLEVVHRPMDLKTIEKKIGLKKYQHVS